MSDELTELPEGWVWTNFEELAERIPNALKAGPFGSALKKSFYVDSGYKIYGQEQVINENPFLGNYYIDENRYEALKSCAVKSGDILISLVGTIGKILILPEDIEPGIINPRLVKLSLDKLLIDNKFIKKYLESPSVHNYFSRLSHGGTMEILNLSILKTLTIALPPLNEQKRIVAKIEELNDRTHKTKEALDSIPQLCDRFRQSVLAAAFRGDLTADWREQNPDVEPASVLLDKTLQEKQNRTKNKLKNNELNILIDKELEELPKNWHWATFEQVSERVTVGHVGSMKDEYINEGIPFLRSQNVRENRFEPTGLQFISEEFHKKLSKSSLQPGDLVVVRSGSVGTACVIPNYLKEANCSDLVIVKQPKAINPYYGSYYMNSVARSHVYEKQVGVALIHFNTKSMAQLPIPIPPYEEQKEIIRLVQMFFKAVDVIEQKYYRSKEYLDQLNQSILAKAFRGELVPQDLDDEPASVLLERIRAEREKLNNSKPKSKRTSTRKSKTPEGQVSIPGLE